jgi:two-component system chemotaxis sensor kinase CheA
MFGLDDDIMRQLRATFKVEAAEHIQAMNRVLLALENNPEGEERARLLEEIFREAHSLKGAAGAADFGEVEATAHKLESVFGAARSGKLTLTRELCDVLYAGIDAVNIIVEASLAEKPHSLDLLSLYQRLDEAEQGHNGFIHNPAPGVEPVAGSLAPTEAANVKQLPAQPLPLPNQTASTAAEPKAARPAKGDERKNRPAHHAPAIEETIRVATSKLDSLMTQAGELLVAGLKIDQRLHDVEEVNRSIEDWNREWLKTRAANSNLLHNADHEAIRPLVKLLDMSQERLRVLSTLVGDLRRGFARDALHLSRVTNDLGEGVMKVRMLPVSTVFDAFPRLVRDVARECGKEVELKTEGGETELDRKVLEEIKDPLIHLLRNCVDHGVEPPDERAQVGKPRQGTVTVKAFQKGNNIVIEVSDDGQGINRARVKQAAVKSGLIDADEAEILSEDETLRLIFASGLSTRFTVTDISGRGIGMDVVRKNVEALQGQVDVETTLGQGTTITLTLPLTLATTQELLVQVDDQTYGIPISAVERIQRIRRGDISQVEGRPALVVDDEPVSLVSLADVLERPRAEQETNPGDKMPVVILSSGRKRIGFLVDGVVGQQETVVKSLGKQLSRVRNVAGATILGTGQVIITLNPSDLMKSARGGGIRSTQAKSNNRDSVQAVKQHTVLVVDDSLSTRTLEKNILETAGYKVTLATDGMDAMSLLSSNGGFDLIVSDVLMPRMSGIELTTVVKRDPRLKKIPVILVTSLDSRSDKEKGLEAGADAYLVKSNFDQANLLQTIAQLI